MLIIEKKHIKLLVIGFILAFIIICTVTVLLTSLLFASKYDTIYTDDIYTIKYEIQKYREMDKDTLNSLENKYKKIIEQKDIEINKLSTNINGLESTYTKYKEDKENDIDILLEYAYVLDRSERYYLSYENIKSIIYECKKENFNSYMPHLVVALMEFESGLNPTAISRSNARGIAQFKEGTAKWIYEEHLEYIDYNHGYAFDTGISIQMCIKYLSILYDQHNGDINKMLVGYNGGEIGDKYYININNNMLKNSGYTIYDVCKSKGDENIN